MGCVVRMVGDSILPHAEFGSNDHLEDASHFTKPIFSVISLEFK